MSRWLRIVYRLNRNTLLIISHLLGSEYLRLSVVRRVKSFSTRLDGL
jgi:hypothetical protein